MLLPLLAALTLTVSSASNRAVGLSWTGASGPVVLERKPAGTPWPTTPVAPLTSPTGAAYADASIDAFATYTYRVKAGAVLSNEVTVGPPPVGMSQVLRMPALLLNNNSRSFAGITRLVFDANGDPLLAYVTTDANGDGDPADGALFTVSWNRARYAWNAAVKVDDVGAVPTQASNIPLSIARDASSGTLGLLYVVGTAHDLRFATSVDGAAWTHTTVRHTNDEAASVASPALAMAAGRVHVAYTAGPDTLLYATGGVADAPTAWRTTVAPHPAGTRRYHTACVNVVLDATNSAGVSFCAPPEEGYTTSVWYWKVGGAASKITDTDIHQTDDPSLSLALRGSTVVAVFGGARDDRFFSDHHLWGVVSRTNGATWGPAMAIADDGGHAMDAPTSVGVRASGIMSTSAVVNGGSEGKNRCGQPKLAQSGAADAWSTCAPDTKGLPDTSNPGAAVLGVAGNDKLYIAFRTTGAAGALAPGLLLWRER
jgi:hypothetical protein